MSRTEGEISTVAHLYVGDVAIFLTIFSVKNMCSFAPRFNHGPRNAAIMTIV